MKILEVRDGFVKFEADENIFLSAFIKVDGIEKSYIAQVMQLKNAVAYAKILFLYDDELQPYDRTLPSEDSEIEEVTLDILNNSVRADHPIIAGKGLSGINLITDASAFDKKMLISVDGKDENNILIRNFVKQFNHLNKNVVIIDTLGIIDARKAVAGVDFKLPLDTDSLAFMYQDCLNDATAESKSLIIEIFRDLSDYSKTVPFVPFEALKTIVDDMVDKQHVFKLLVLKNKLAKLDRLGYFAKDKNEVDKLDTLLDSKCSIIDLSKLDNTFQNRYLAFLYEKLQAKENTQVFLELSNIVNKKNLKNILSEGNSTATTIVTHSRFKYLNDIKNLFDNFIVAPSFANNEIFNIYGTFLSSMPESSYLITGEAVNYIPLVSNLQEINEFCAVPEESTLQTDDSERSEIVETEESSNEQESVEESIAEDENSACEDSELEEICDESDFADETTEIQEDIQEVEEETLTNEEILANIEEKSEAIISEAAKDIILPPTETMFDNEDGEEETEDDVDDSIEEDIAVADTTIAAAAAEEEEEEEISGEFGEIDSSEEILNESFSDENIQEEIEHNDFPEKIEEEFESIDEETKSKNETEEVEEVEEVEELDVSELDDSSNIQEEIDFANESQEDELDSDSLSEEYEELDFNNNLQNEIEISDEIDLELGLDSNLEEKTEEEKIQNLPDFDPNTIQFQPLNQEYAVEYRRDYSELDEIAELDPEEADENDIVINIEEEDDIPPLDDEQIVQEVDKVFTTRKDDDISDSDLDFIDELNNDGELEDETVLEELSPDEDGILEEPQEQFDLDDNSNNEILETRNSSTPMVPVYEADIPEEDMVTSDPISQGDSVTHAKYGNGVVEKMIKYGNKTLFSINFENIGRRLLDPTLTEIKKV